MNFSKWLEIESDYEAAKACLWRPREAGEWHRVYAKGHFHLWKAYYAATQEEEKQDLLYARILMMMADEDREDRFNNYIRCHRYIAPAKHAYERAIQNNEVVCDKEYEELYSPKAKQYKKKLSDICNKYKYLASFSYIYDEQNLLGLKDAPNDRGQEIFEQLYRKRIKVRW